MEFHSYYYDSAKREPVTSDFLVPSGTEMTPGLLKRMIDEHKASKRPRYDILGNVYDARFEIFGLAAKPDYKPDNRLAADFAYNITQAFEGFFIGIPIDIRHEDAAKAEWIEQHRSYNFQDEIDADLSETASKYGHAYEMLYQDDEGRPRSACISPLSAFAVYDDSTLKRPMWFVRYVYGEDGGVKGTFSDSEWVYRFSSDGGGLSFDGMEPHYFGSVPFVEFMQNSSKRGLYEGVLNLIDAYNRVLSEKANDVEYFADAYLEVTGVELPDDFKQDLREYRLINLFGQDSGSINVSFLAKPSADAEQENLVNRLEMLIFKMAMVPDITDESFSTASGTALKMRLMPMNNLARNKERKFVAGIKRRLKMLAAYPGEPFKGDDWTRCEVVMHRNMPEDLASEASVAGSLSGIVSEETQLSVLSCVDDPKKEIERKNTEKQERSGFLTDGMPTSRINADKEEDHGNDGDL